MIRSSFLAAWWLFPVLWSSCATHVAKNENLVPVAKGFSGTSVNATIFRSNSIVSHRQFQFVAFYDSVGRVVVARRNIANQDWQIVVTDFSGNIKDAHNGISIMADGDGYLHMAWDHHNTPLKCVRSIAPGSLEFGNIQSMTGEQEGSVSYPEFYRFSNGDLLFAYRDGKSGSGDLVLNRYSVSDKKWSRLQSNLISGEDSRNAYWQMFIDASDNVHLSWVWRESPAVESNHDLCYAISRDGGKSWLRSEGSVYDLPITAVNAEYAARIGEGSDLINQTSMTADANGHPYIATYFQQGGDCCPQYYVVYQDGNTWKTSSVYDRSEDFNLAGGGTKSIPISRPKIISYQKDNRSYLLVIYRDAKKGNVPMMSACETNKFNWTQHRLSEMVVDKWEPSVDTELWKEGMLHIFLQHVSQGDAEEEVDVPAQMVYVLEFELDNVITR